MAVLDKALQRITANDALAVVLESGRVPYFETSEGNRPLVRWELKPGQVAGYLRELIEPEQVASLRGPDPFTFRYRGFRVNVTFPGEGISARITPDRTPRAVAPEPEDPPADQNAIDPILREMIARNASDLHLTVGEPPIYRIHGEMTRTQNLPLTSDAMESLLRSICPEANRREFEENWDTDFAYEIAGLARFRCNYFRDRHGPGAVLRQIPMEILTVEQLGLSEQVVNLCDLTKGFVVVTGPTGSGKSTTLAGMVDRMNRTRGDHIITIEDPVEFVHANKRCLVNHREVGVHTRSFRAALRAALREDPDILLVGEMRDLETISIALETAETGHLVFGTLHTTTAPSTVDRIIDQFPADRQSQVRVMLSESLKGVIAQTLCKRVGGGRVAAYEVLLVNTAIANLIREAKTFQIPSIMQTQRGIGNITLNDSLLDLVRKGLVEPREAYLKCVDKEGLTALFKRHDIAMAA